MDLQSLDSLASSRRVSHQLRMAALLQTREPEHTRINSLRHSQQAMVLQQNCLLIPQCPGNILAFLLSQHDT